MKYKLLINYFILLILSTNCIKNETTDLKKIELKSIKNEILANSLQLIKSNNTNEGLFGISSLAYLGQESVKFIKPLTNLPSEIVFSSLSIINDKKIEKEIDSFISNLETPARISFLAQRVAGTKNKKYFKWIIKDYKTMTNYEDMSKTLYYMTKLNKFNIQKFFKKEMDYFGNIVLNQIFSFSNNLNPERLNFYRFALQYLGSLDNSTKYFSFITDSIFMTTNNYSIENATEILENLNFWTYGKNRILFSDILIKSKIWNNISNLTNRLHIKTFISALTTNYGFKNEVFREIRESDLEEYMKEFFLFRAGNEDIIIKYLYSDKWKRTMASILYYNFLDFIDEIELFISKEEYKKFVSTKNDLKDAEEFIFLEFLTKFHQMILEEKEPLKKHIQFLYDIRKKDFVSTKVVTIRAKLDLLTSQLIWLVENGYFEYE